MKIFKVNFIIAVMLLALLIPVGVSAAPSDGITTSVNFTPADILVKFNPAASPAEVALIHRQNEGQVKKLIAELGVQVVTVPSGKVLEKVRAYRANPKVVYAEPDYLAKADLSPDDPYFSQQWGLTKIQAMQAWDITTGVSEVKIAILDTGVYLTHPDLSAKIIESVNFTTSTTANDSYGHGTHVAGIAAASTNNSLGTAGLGYNSTILNVKVLGDDGYGSYSWISQGIIWAADNGAKVINMSLGGTSPSSTLEAAINYAWQKGVVVVASAGNNSSSTPSYPAYYAKVIAVAATDSSDRIAYYSSYGDWVDVASPGSSIYSTKIYNSYGYMSGTSMAAPHVSGLASLVFTCVTDTNGNHLVNDEVRTQIETTCDDIGATNIGGGRINAYKAVQTQTTTETGTIAGVVTDSATGSPVPGASVTDGIRSSMTGPDGNYAINDVPVGEYIVTATAEGYEDEIQNIVVVAEQTTTASFSLTETSTPPPDPPAPVQDLWVSSTELGLTGKIMRLTIQVTGETGVVSSAQVTAQITCDDRTWDFTGTTDSTGTVVFTISKPSTGTYEALVTGVTADGYEWDDSVGDNTASFTVAARTKPTKK